MRTERRNRAEEEEFDYESDLEIDPFALDTEFANHPIVFMKYAKASAKANKIAKLAEEKVKTVRSQLIKEAKESGEKHTETTLEAYYRTQPEYQKAKQEWIDATYEADLLNNAVFAFQARKLALENLVVLQGREYYSEPQVPRDSPDVEEAVDKIKKKGVTNKIRERMKK